MSNEGKGPRILNGGRGQARAAGTEIGGSSTDDLAVARDGVTLVRGIGAHCDRFADTFLAVERVDHARRADLLEALADHEERTIELFREHIAALRAQAAQERLRLAGR